MPEIELLPADKRAKILATLTEIAPMTNVQVLNGITKGTIGLRLQRRLLDLEAEVERLNDFANGMHLVATGVIAGTLRGVADDRVADIADLRNDRDNARQDLERLRTGETCVVGMPMSCGDAHTAGHCVRVISRTERDALAEVHRLRTKHNDWTRNV